MLSIDERAPVERFAHLEDLTVSVPTDRRRVEAEHAGERQPPAGHIAARHPHPPIRYEGLVAIPSGAALMVEFHENNAVLHELPSGIHVHIHVFVLPSAPL